MRPGKYVREAVYTAEKDSAVCRRHKTVKYAKHPYSWECLTPFPNFRTLNYSIQ